MRDEEEPAQNVVESAVETFRSQKELAERAMAQLGDGQLHQALHVETNPIAVIVKHMAGNMRSRWTDFLATDGEKPWRDRDREFVDDIASREELMSVWEEGWEVLFRTLGVLTPDDLASVVRIRGEPHTVIRAIHRQLSHYGYHVGQIVLTARVLADDEWETLSIPRGGSKDYNERVWSGEE